MATTIHNRVEPSDLGSTSLSGSSRHHIARQLERSSPRTVLSRCRGKLRRLLRFGWPSAAVLGDSWTTRRSRARTSVERQLGPCSGLGLGVWSDSTLTDGVQFSNEPGTPDTIHERCFLPWTTPVTVEIGNTVSVTLRSDLIGEDYISSWNTLVLEQGCDRITAEFKQSPFVCSEDTTAPQVYLKATLQPRPARGRVQTWWLGLWNHPSSFLKIGCRRHRKQVSVTSPQAIILLSFSWRKVQFPAGMVEGYLPRRFFDEKL